MINQENLIALEKEIAHVKNNQGNFLLPKIRNMRGDVLHIHIPNKQVDKFVSILDSCFKELHLGLNMAQITAVLINLINGAQSKKLLIDYIKNTETYYLTNCSLTFKLRDSVLIKINMD